jgi:hypothetical protein
MAQGMGPASDWVREIAEADRRLGHEATVAKAEIMRRKEQFASAAVEMMTRLSSLFEQAVAAFNATSPVQPLAISRLKGSGFAVSRGNRRLSVLKSADWNVIFSFSDPPKTDLFAILSRLDRQGVRWRLYQKSDDKDGFEAAPDEPGDVAETVSKRLFVRLVRASGPRSYRLRTSDGTT